MILRGPAGGFGALAGLLLGFCGGCTDVGRAPLFSDATHPFFVTGSNPAQGATDVPTDVFVEVDLSDVPWPASLAGDWELASGGLHYTSVATCDLVDRRVRIRAARGLQPHFSYTLTLLGGLRSFADLPLDPAPIHIKFQTGLAPAGPPPTTPVDAAQALGALGAGGCTGCHAEAAPAGELNLASVAGLAAAIGRVSARRPNAVLITPSSHATSYLLWKALGLPRTFGHRTPVLEHDAARALADWIDQGAGID